MKARVLLLSITFLAASAFIARASRPETTLLRESLSGMPMRIGSWEGRETIDIAGNIMAVLGVDDYVSRFYYNHDNFPVSLYIGYYRSQRQGDTIHSPLNCLPGAGWNPVKNGHISIPLGGNSNIEINRIVIMRGLDKQLVLYWYQSHGRVVASEYWSKIYTVLDAIRTNRTDAALVRAITPITGLDEAGEVVAERNAVEFVQSMFPLLERYLPD